MTRLTTAFIAGLCELVIVYSRRAEQRGRVGPVFDIYCMNVPFILPS